jgi:chromosomal replication initiation ATPase DnaA
VCELGGVTAAEFYSKSRKAEIIDARRIACYLYYKFSHQGLVDIAKKVNKDHTTIIHYCSSVQNLLKVGDERTVNLYYLCTQKMKELNGNRAVVS